jgi:ribosomal protein S18 acetylase RimI-like enzyme
VTDVRTATASDLDAVADALGTAFADDPVVRWLLPSGDRVNQMFRVLARYQHGLGGGTDIAHREGNAVGASLWDRPGYRQSPRNFAAAALPFMRTLRARTHYGQALERVFHRHRPEGTFWYLASVGATVPGQGVGSALLQYRLDRIEGPSYLESSNEANIALYERFGFRVTGQIRLPFSGPTCWPMYRP